jgi:hypothetical protein
MAVQSIQDGKNEPRMFCEGAGLQAAGSRRRKHVLF